MFGIFDCNAGCKAVPEQVWIDRPAQALASSSGDLHVSPVPCHPPACGRQPQCPVDGVCASSAALRKNDPMTGEIRLERGDELSGPVKLDCFVRLGLCRRDLDKPLIAQRHECVIEDEAEKIAQA